MSRGFRTTHWSQVQAGAREDTPQGREALGRLYEAYWDPLYAYVRRRGYDIEEARELTQAYFVRLLEKNYLRDARPEAGRFRTYLLTSLQHFLANEWDRSRARKRGGGQTLLSLDTEAAEKRYRIELADEATPETLYERRWAMTVLERVLDRLREAFSRAGRSRQFEKLRGYLTGEAPRIPYRQVAEELEMSEGAVKVAVHRLRRQFGQVLREEIAHTVAHPEQIEEEIRHLLSRMG